MAVTVLTSTQAKFNTVTPKALVAATAQADGFEFEPIANDEQTILVVYNANAAAQDITIKAPTNKTYSSALTDKVVEVGIGQVALVLVETCKYKDVVSGKVKIIPEHVDVKAALFHAKGLV